MIKAALELVISKMIPQIFTSDKREAIVVLKPGGGTEVILEHDMIPNLFIPPVKTGTVDSFCKHVAKCFPKEKTHVVVGTDGCIALHDVDGTDYGNRQITLPFFNADFPPNGRMSHETFMDYLDQHTDFIPDAESIVDTLKSITISEGEKVTSTEVGAAINITFSGKKNIEGATAQLPKFITVELRRGTREYSFLHKFRLHVTAEEKNLYFRMVHLNRDGAEEKFLEKCLADVTEKLGEGWHIIQGS